MSDDIFVDSIIFAVFLVLGLAALLLLWLAWSRTRDRTLHRRRGRVIEGYQHVLWEREPVYAGEDRDAALERIYARQPDMRETAKVYPPIFTPGPRSPYNVPPGSGSKGPPGVLVLLALGLLLSACAQQVAANKAAAARDRELAALQDRSTQEIAAYKAWADEAEGRIITAGGTQDVIIPRRDIHRSAVDKAIEVMEGLRLVLAKALSPPGAPAPATPAGGGR